MNLLKITQLTKSYHHKTTVTTILKDINLEVEAGETVAVMGPSGSGKTTLLNLISGIDRGDRGEVCCQGENITALSRSSRARWRRHNLGMVFQDYNLLDCLDVKGNILVPLTLERINRADQETRMAELAAAFHLESLLDKDIADLSGGEQQRVAIARAVANKPALLLADEPTGNLDSKSSRDVMEYLLLANARDNATLLMVTHDPFAAAYCRRVILLQDGVIAGAIAKTGSRREFLQAILGLELLKGGDADDR